jgi:hypothetical protein
LQVREFGEKKTENVECGNLSRLYESQADNRPDGALKNAVRKKIIHWIGQDF